MGLLAWLLDAIEALISKPASAKTNRFLAGPYGPVVEEHAAVKCEVEGTLPAALNGEFARNGPNPALPCTDGYHWFDGDGMVHSVRIKNGTATYSNRYVKTLRYRDEMSYKRALYLKIGSFEGPFALLHIWINRLRSSCKIFTKKDEAGNINQGGTANTALAFHAGRLLALHEGDVPYALRVMCDGVLETIGQVSFDGKLQTPFTAHPKILPSNGTMYAIGYNFEAAPHLMYHVIDKTGAYVTGLPIAIPEPTMQHDFAITSTRAIFLDFPIVFNPKKLFSQGMPLEFDPSKGARFGLLPLDAASGSEVRWFTLPKPVACFHTMNAWDEGDDVHILLCEYESFKLSFEMEDGKMKRSELPDLMHYTIRPSTGEVSREHVCRLPNAGLEFPQFNRSLLGLKNRYGYATLYGMEDCPAGIVKVDLQAAGLGANEKAVVGRVAFGDGCFGGEPVFIPDTDKARAANGKAAAEDAGFLATFVLNDAASTSELVVWDAQNLSKGAVARVKIPARVPLGFHALFVSEEELQLQQASQGPAP